MSGAVALMAERLGHRLRHPPLHHRLLGNKGIVYSSVMYYVQGLVTRAHGPMFVTAFQSLCMTIIAVLGSTILGEEITLGSVIGAVIIVVGLYAFIWGKGGDHADNGKPPAAATPP
uniref:WAT1-related protein n=1 Tax=Oryza glumipatula TaxID=40148 RepID=A0A0E0A2E9_9ORYZ